MTTDQERPTPRRRRTAAAPPDTDPATEQAEQIAATGPPAEPTVEPAAAAEPAPAPASVARAVFSGPSVPPRAEAASTPAFADGPEAAPAQALAEADTEPEAGAGQARTGRTRRPRRAAVARTDEVRAEAAPDPEADAAAVVAKPAAMEPRRPAQRRTRAATSETAIEPLPAPVAAPASPDQSAAIEPQPEPEAAVAGPFDDDDLGGSPATVAELAEIARATGARGSTTVAIAAEPWLLDDDAVALVPPGETVDGLPAAEIGGPLDDDELDELEEMGEGDAADVPRRRRRRGRRGRGRPVAPSSDEAASAMAAPVEPATSTQQEVWTPILPSYGVEFEPLPPPTKRRPSRRPGMTSQPRFSPAEQREVDAFVQQPVQPSAAPVLAASVGLVAAPLTAEEERELAAAKARPSRRRGGRGRGAKAAVPAADLSGLQETPAFAPLPPTSAIASGAGSLEALLVRQNVILDTMMERQTALLRNIERSLIALDRRLASVGGGSASTPRVGIFVDVPNVMYAAERLGWTVDFGKLLDLLTRGRELVRASAYSPVSDDPQMRLDTQRFAQPFVGRGYRLVTKPLKRFADGTMKGNFDVEMAMDMLTMADRLDIVCLISGDGDFSHLVETVQARGVRVEVAAFSASTSGDLRAVCDVFTDLTHLQREIAM